MKPYIYISVSIIYEQSMRSYLCTTKRNLHSDNTPFCKLDINEGTKGHLLKGTN